MNGRLQIKILDFCSLRFKVSPAYSVCTFENERRHGKCKKQDKG